MGTIDVAERGDVDQCGVARMDDDLADLTGGLEPDAAPGLPRVGRLEHPVAKRDRVAHVSLAGADVDDVGIRRRHCDRADGRDAGAVEDRRPGPAGVDRLPYAATDRPGVERVRLADDPRHRVDAAGAERTDVPPAPLLEHTV